MKICRVCNEEKEMVFGKRLCYPCYKEWRKESYWKVKRGENGKICPICKEKHFKMAVECSLKCSILNRYEIVNGCWEWTGKIAPSGYGNVVKSKKGKRSHLLAHRESYKLFKGEIPEGLYVCHSCDNKKCINPEHLWVGTCKDNIQDAKDKGRLPDQRGEKNGSRKLSEKDVLEIRKLLEMKKSKQEIMDKYGIARITVYAIETRKIWSHI